MSNSLQEKKHGCTKHVFLKYTVQITRTVELLSMTLPQRLRKKTNKEKSITCLNIREPDMDLEKLYNSGTSRNHNETRKKNGKNTTAV